MSFIGIFSLILVPSGNITTMQISKFTLKVVGSTKVGHVKSLGNIMYIGISQFLGMSPSTI